MAQKTIILLTSAGATALGVSAGTVGNTTYAVVAGNTNASFTLPGDWPGTADKIEVWAAGSGAGVSNSPVGSGGGYSATTNVSISGSLPYYIGLGAAQNTNPSPKTGGDSYAVAMTGTAAIVAKGGDSSTTPKGAAINAGGAGGAGGGTPGGGGAGGPSGVGSASGGAPQGYAAGAGNGGSTAGDTSNVNGGGGAKTGARYPGGGGSGSYKGGDGQVRLTYTPAAPPPAPTNTASPSLTGSPRVGQTLTCSPGSWTGSPTFAYVWSRDDHGTPIAGATSATYVLQSADLGARVYCIVTATNGGGSASAQTDSVGPITTAQTYTGSAALSASAGFVGSGHLVAHAGINVSPALVFAAAAMRITRGTVSITVASSTLLFGRRVQHGTIALSPQASVSAAASATPKTSTVAVLAHASAAFTGKLVAHPNAAAQSTALVTAVGSRLQKTGTAAMAAVSVVAAGRRVQRGAAALTLVGTLAAGARLTARSSASAGISTVVVDDGVVPPRTRQGQAALTGAVSIAGVGKRVQRAAASISPHATTTARGGLRASALAAVSAAMAMNRAAETQRFGSRAAIQGASTVTGRGRAIFRFKAPITPKASVSGYLVDAFKQPKRSPRAQITAPAGSPGFVNALVTQLNTYLGTIFSTRPPTPPRVYDVPRPQDLPAAADYPLGWAWVVSLKRAVVSDGVHWLRMDTGAVVA